jgi:hypothetical protein
MKNNTEMLKHISGAENCLNEHIITNRKKTCQQTLDLFVKKNLCNRKMLKECKVDDVSVVVVVSEIFSLKLKNTVL